MTFLTSTYRTWSLLTGLLLLVASPVWAQGFRSPALDHVQWTAQAVPATVAPGQTFTVQLQAQIGDGWKMYAMDSPRPSIGVAPTLDDLPEGVSLAEAWQQTAPKEAFDPNFNMDVRYFEGTATLVATLEVAETATAESYPITGTVRFQICNDRLCLPPTQVPFEATVVVDAATASSGTATAPSTAPPTQAPDRSSALDLQAPSISAEPDAEPAAPEATLSPPAPAAGGDLAAARSGGFWGFLLLAVGAGLAALLTPCVFPMIPLTVSFFTKHAGSRAEAFRMASVYGLAIVVTFTGLGVLMALLVGAAGAQTIAANPWLNLFIGLVFVFFALSLLGLFELRLPSSWLNYLNRQGTQRQGYAGVLFMGLTLTFVSFSCTAPFVGGLLAATAGGEWAYPVLGMLVFSTTFALPFFLFALFPKALSSLPRSGAWLNSVKVVLGFVELAAALKFLSNADLIWGWNVLSRPLAIAATVVILFLAGMYLIGKLRLAHEPAPEEVGVVRLLFAILFFGLSLYMMPGLLGAPLGAIDAYLPPRQATDVSLLAALPMGQNTSHNDEAWFTDDIEGAFAEAERQNKPLFIDFTGYTCTNCREMEANVFPRPNVAQRFDDFVLLRLYTDGLENGEDFQRYQLRLTGTVALPTYAVVDPQSRTLLERITGVTAPDDFAAFLDAGRAAYQERAIAGASAGESLSTAAPASR